MVIEQVSQGIHPEIHSQEYEVSKVLIHLLSCILQRHGSWLNILSIAATVMSAKVCPSPLKCCTTEDSSVFLSMMLKRWPMQLILRCSGCPVSPTYMYCWPHLRQVIRQIILEDLQEAVKFILNTWLVVWLVNSSVVVNIGHVLQPTAPQGQLSGSSRLVTVRDACTKDPLNFSRVESY